MIIISNISINRDNLNPKFATPIVLDYRFEERQNLRFLVVDIDKEGGKLEEQEIIGTVISFYTLKQHFYDIIY